MGTHVRVAKQVFQTQNGTIHTSTDFTVKTNSLLNGRLQSWGRNDHQLRLGLLPQKKTSVPQRAEKQCGPVASWAENIIASSCCNTAAIHIAVMFCPGQHALRHDTGPANACPAKARPNGSEPLRAGGQVRQKTRVQNIWELFYTTLSSFFMSPCYLNLWS